MNILVSPEIDHRQKWTYSSHLKTFKNIVFKQIARRSSSRISENIQEDHLNNAGSKNIRVFPKQARYYVILSFSNIINKFYQPKLLPTIQRDIIIKFFHSIQTAPQRRPRILTYYIHQVYHHEVLQSTKITPNNATQYYH